MTVWRSGSEEETRALGRDLAREVTPSGVLLLSGDLGCGKTVLAQGVGLGLGVEPREIQSPTFTLVHFHDGERGALVHIDLYRLDAAEVAGLGLEEVLAGPGVKVVEWAERLPFPVPGGRWLRFRRLPGGEREIEERAPASAPPGDGAGGEMG